MNYNISDIEDQIVSTLKANSDLDGADVRTHAGDINVNLVLHPEYWEGLIPRLPFVYLRYQGRTGRMVDDIGLAWEHILQFQLYVGASSLRSKQESQRSCYSMLASIFDSIAGYWPYSTAQVLPSGMQVLSGTQITVANFQALTPLREVGGQDEKLIIELPKIAVYSTSYDIMLVP